MYVRANKNMFSGDILNACVGFKHVFYVNTNCIEIIRMNIIV